jgi:membrane protein implicated in regulation of membrane protease activity
VIAGILEELGAWSWWIIGLLLLGLEIVVPGSFFLWFGVSALIVGTSALLIDWPWQFQIVGFVVLALALVAIGRRYFSRAEESDRPFLNERAERLVGTSHVLGEPIVNGHGRVSIEDTSWRVSGPDTAAGTRVRVVGADGSILKVEPVSSG